jgi:acetyl-CoA carboxylase carboxyl transferase subunit alpha
MALESNLISLVTDGNYMTPAERVNLARHERRPYTLDYIELVCEDFVEMHGDRNFGDDAAIVTGLATLDGREVVVIGHQKGRNMRERQIRNFGMPKPEGYRKALRVMKLAEKFRRPVICFIDTSGAYPGIEAEERGQAEAIARNLREMARLDVPIIVTVTGEGGSGGALAIGVGDVVNMMENAVYSVITPEGCAAILWKDSTLAPQAAASLKLTAADLVSLGIADKIIPEPPGGAQENWEMSAGYLRTELVSDLAQADKMSSQERRAARYDKFKAMGKFLG